jgi:hypothetical protein
MKNTTTVTEGEMTGHLVDIITASDPEVRNRSLDAFCESASIEELLQECEQLEAFRHSSTNLYERCAPTSFCMRSPLSPAVQAGVSGQWPRAVRRLSASAGAAL